MPLLFIPHIVARQSGYRYLTIHVSEKGKPVAAQLCQHCLHAPEYKISHHISTSTGGEVGDLELPPWAADAQDFAQKLAEALECPLVSAGLHRWIDLIFGCYNQGQKAQDKDNVFYYLTYDDM